MVAEEFQFTRDSKEGTKTDMVTQAASVTGSRAKRHPLVKHVLLDNMIGPTTHANVKMTVEICVEICVEIYEPRVEICVEICVHMRGDREFFDPIF